MKLYLDNCCYNRIFDNQNNILNRLETLSINTIKYLIKNEKYRLTWLYDAFHIACAIYDDCDFFITVDKGILKKRNNINDIVIYNPIDFIKEVENA